MSTNRITNVDAAIAALGGTVEASRLLRRTPSAVSQWRITGVMPMKLYPVVRALLAERKFDISERVFGFAHARRKQSDAGAAPSVLAE